MYCDKICLNLNKYWISPYHKRLVFISISFPTYIQLSVQSVEPITATVLHTEGHLLKVKPFISALFPQNDMEKEAKCGKFSFCFSREPSPHRPHRTQVFHLVSLSASVLSQMSGVLLETEQKINKIPDWDGGWRRRWPDRWSHPSHANQGERRNWLNFHYFDVNLCGVLEIMC